MKCDIIVAGVGGQGTLSVSSIIASAAMSEGLSVRQSEVHGMSQRGGAVVTNLRLSDQPIASDLIARGTASVILSIEPLEGLRYLEYLSPDGTLVSSTNPVVNIPDCALTFAAKTFLNEPLDGFRLDRQQRLASAIFLRVLRG